MNRNLSNKWAQINQASNRGVNTGREHTSGNNLANTMRHTTVGGGLGSQNALNTSSGGFKDRLQNKFANKPGGAQNNNGSLGGGAQ